MGHTSTTCNVRGALRIYTVVSADFRSLSRNRLASSAAGGASAISKALALAAFFAYFLPLLEKSMPPKA